jgi:hypothetical protein
MAILVSRAPSRHRRCTINLILVNRLSATKATVFAILATSSEMFDVPVYWPILVVYFLVLFGITMKRQIR